MRHRLMVLIPALAALATLSVQAPAYADPPTWTSGDGQSDHDRDHDRDHDEDRRDDRPGERDRDHEHHHRWDERHDNRPYDRPYDSRHGYHDYYGTHGSRGYHGYYGDDWDSDYGVVRSGRCDTDAVLGVAGAVTGAIIGHNTAGPGNRGIATIIGAIAGGIIGSAVGDSIDDGDRACIGHSLELGRVGLPVVWVNPRSRVAWRVVPLRDVSQDCREFEVRRDYRGRLSDRTVVACRRDRGYWEFRGR